jgi:hypothetical protein
MPEAGMSKAENAFSRRDAETAEFKKQPDLFDVLGFSGTFSRTSRTENLAQYHDIVALSLV